MSSAPEDLHARFYEDYRKVAEDYDKEFMKKYDEDLNTTLIFVRPAHRPDTRVLTWISQAGLFSAVTSAFIIQVQPELQPDPNEETAALLRVLIHKTDNTTFGGNVPTVPQWSGPPRSIVQVQAMLYASFAATLLSAFLAMLGKQWLNRYASTDMRGTAVERSQNRQRKLNGIVTWYFEHVMESLPLMLQAALLLLGWALCQYLWEIDLTVATVVLCVTAFGLAFYFFVVAAGAASGSCPYQTPGSRALRSVVSAVPPAFKYAVEHSAAINLFRSDLACCLPSTSIYNLVCSLMTILCGLPVVVLALAIDVTRLGVAMVRLLVTFTRRAYIRLFGAPSTPTHGSDQETTPMHLQCVSWILQTSQDKTVHLSTLESLATMVELDDLDPTLVADCFDIFIGCVKVVDRTAMVTQVLEPLATVSATCLLLTFSHLSVVDPSSDILGEVRRRYMMVFDPWTNTRGLPFPYTFCAIEGIFYPDRDERWLDLGGYKPSSDEQIITAHALTKFAWSEYRRIEYYGRKVPRWILRFAFHSLSMDPLPSTSVVVNCLSIIAIDLGCDIDVSSTRTTTTDERCVRVQ